MCADGYHDVVNQGQDFVKTLLEKVGWLIDPLLELHGGLAHSDLHAPAGEQTYIACRGFVWDPEPSEAWKTLQAIQPAELLHLHARLAFPKGMPS